MTRFAWVMIVVTALGAGCFDGILRGFWPFPWSSVSWVLPMIVLGILFQRPQVSWVCAGISGLMMELFAWHAGVLLLLLGCVALLQLFARTVLTNRSVYSAVVLIAMARLFESIWYVGFAGSSWLRFPYGFLADLSCVFLLYPLCLWLSSAGRRMV